jgi:hypothetical protein
VNELVRARGNRNALVDNAVEQEGRESIIIPSGLLIGNGKHAALAARVGLIFAVETIE